MREFSSDEHLLNQLISIGFMLVPPRRVIAPRPAIMPDWAQLRGSCTGPPLEKDAA